MSHLAPAIHVMQDKSSKNGCDRPRIAWLLPSLKQGNYWHPVFKELATIYPQSIVYTGVWTGFAPGYEDAFAVEVVGQMKFVEVNKPSTSYGHGFIYVSLDIVKPLLKFKPNVVFASGFSLWTILSLLLKPIGGWRLVVMYDGSSPTVDFLNSPLRLFLRRCMSLAVDGFITNSQAGHTYLTQILGVAEDAVFARPYQVPDTRALLQRTQAQPASISTQAPVFLFIGQLVLRKGLHLLLEACNLLREQGYEHYSLLIIGEGEQRQELEAYCHEHSLQNHVSWLGLISYGDLGTYFNQADVFILPTLEDIWGMVVLEAMALGKPVLCSQWAGASELVAEGENGYVFDPLDPAAIAQVMSRCIDHPEQLPQMGQRAQALIAQHTPENAAKFLTDVVNKMLAKKQF